MTKEYLKMSSKIEVFSINTFANYGGEGRTLAA
jgi:hypothetical protein